MNSATVLITEEARLAYENEWMWLWEQGKPILRWQLYGRSLALDDLMMDYFCGILDDGEET